MFKRELKRHATDWITILIIASVFILYLEFAPAHSRQFQINDPKISHSFANPQIVNDFKLYVLVFIIPSIIIVTVSYMKKPQDFIKLTHISMLGLVASFIITGFITDLLKIWISRPRPDFITRCQPDSSTPLDTYVSLEVCTQENQFILNDGLKSCPSGHSSLSMSGGLFLCLWISGQLKSFNKTSPLYIQFLSWGYILVALFIAISRHLDYRHHVEDIIFGLIIGGVVSYTIYFRYFNDLTSEKCDSPLEENPVLPV